MAVPYSFPHAGDVSADNRPRRCCQRQPQTSAPEGVSSVLDPDDAALLGIVRQLIDGLISTATS
jgi:hypothetical protein